ncbi:hypothetical protein BXZ70DRAFT_875125, partial [Cristinia sonorae]
PENMRITKDGESVRILGAWFGNKADCGGPWTPTIEKIDNALMQWGRSNPTIEGRQLIVQMVVGGMTQYLTTVQGMPKDVLTKLTKRTRSFMWNGNAHSPVAIEHLYTPISQGG